MSQFLKEVTASSQHLATRLGIRPLDRAALLRAAANLALLAAWLWLYHPVLQYFSVLFTASEFRTNQIMLAGVAGLLVYRLRKHPPRPRLDAAPHLYFPALALALGGSLAYLLVERYLDINTLSASLFGLATYGLIGLWLSPGRWRQGFAPMLLVVGVLPFGAHLETFAGYPLRVLSADLARGALNQMGFHSVGADTILVFESGVSQVDIPCSGVKSLWTGAMFLLAATWIENRPLGLRWLLAALGMAVLLVASNVLRVTALALVGPALGFEQGARMLHLPLGVLGFAGACAAAVFFLGRIPERPAPNAAADARPLRQPAWLGALLAGCGLALALAYTPRPAAAQPAAPPTWAFSTDLAVQPAPLSAEELAWLRQDGADQAVRYSFTWQPENAAQPVTGTFMLLTSQTWRGQHRPERCFQVYGLTVSETYTYLAGADFPMRYLALTAPGTLPPVSAVYWLQSPSQTTEDFGRRIWADLSPQRERWVLVTVLFDRDYAPQLADLNGFFDSLHASVGSSLQKGSAP